MIPLLIMFQSTAGKAPLINWTNNEMKLRSASPESIRRIKSNLLKIQDWPAQHDSNVRPMAKKLDCFSENSPFKCPTVAWNMAYLARRESASLILKFIYPPCQVI